MTRIVLFYLAQTVLLGSVGFAIWVLYGGLVSFGLQTRPKHGCSRCFWLRLWYSLSARLYSG